MLFIQRILNAIPPQVAVRAAVVFEDAHGEVYYIDALFVDSWKVSG